MNNLRLLTALLAAVLSGVSVCAYAEERVVSLDTLFRIADLRSRQLKPSLTGMDEAESGLKVAVSGRLPEIDVNLSVSFIGGGFTTKRNYTDLHRAQIPHLGAGLGIDVKQPLYTGGALTTEMEMAKLGIRAAGYAAEMKRADIRLALATSYLELYKWHNLREVVRANIDRANRELDQMKTRHQQGVALRNDITRYELLLSGLQLQLTKTDNMLDILNCELTTYAGLPPDLKIVPDTTIMQRTLIAAQEEWWQRETSVCSPVLRLAANEIALGKTQEEFAKSELRPKLSLLASWQMNGPILTEIPPVDRNLSYWFVGLGVSYNLSSLYKGNKKLAQARVATRQKMEQLDAEADNLSRAIHSDYVRYRQAYEELLTERKNVELATANYNTVATRFDEGIALITDMLDAANSRLEAEQLLVNARINIIYYYYRLMFTSGKIV